MRFRCISNAYPMPIGRYYQLHRPAAGSSPASHAQLFQCLMHSHIARLYKNLQNHDQCCGIQIADGKDTPSLCPRIESSMKCTSGIIKGLYNERSSVIDGGFGRSLVNLTNRRSTWLDAQPRHSLRLVIVINMRHLLHTAT